MVRVALIKLAERGLISGPDQTHEVFVGQLSFELTCVIFE